MLGLWNSEFFIYTRVISLTNATLSLYLWIDHGNPDWKIDWNPALELHFRRSVKTSGAFASIMAFSLKIFLLPSYFEIIFAQVIKIQPEYFRKKSSLGLLSDLWSARFHYKINHGIYKSEESL